MHQIVFLLSAEKTFSLPLEEGIVTLGRDSDNTVQIEEESISRHHAKFLRLPNAAADEWSVEDLNSANGTRCNGAKVVGSMTLREGDELEFGTLRAIYRNTLPAPFVAAESSPPIAAASSLTPVVVEPPPPPVVAEIPPRPNAAEPSPTRPDAGKESAPSPTVDGALNPFEAGMVLAGVYRLEAFLGEGSGFGSYRAQDTAHQRTVSAKLIHASVLRSPEAAERLSQAIGKLQARPHANIIAPLALEQAGDRTWLISEWVAGLPLLDLLRRRRVLGVREAMLILAQAAAAVDHVCEYDLQNLDLDPRAALLALAAAPTADSPTAASDATMPAKPLLDESLERWPPFLLKLAPLLVMPQADWADDNDDMGTVIPTAVASGGHDGNRATAPALGALLCELLGHPLSRIADGLMVKTPLIASLGESGNEVLKRGMAGQGGFRNGMDFYAALARALHIVVAPAD